MQKKPRARDLDLEWFSAFHRWLQDNPSRNALISEARANYIRWCARRGIAPRSKQGFGYVITAVGISRQTVEGKRYYMAGGADEDQALPLLAEARTHRHPPQAVT